MGAPPSSPASPAQVVPDDDVRTFWDEAMVALSDGQVLTNHSSALLPDLGEDVLNHTVDQSTVARGPLSTL